MELSYKGSIRALRGAGMAFSNFENVVDLNKIGQKINMAVPDSFIEVKAVNEDSVNFSFYFFEKETNFNLKLNESVVHKNEGNAFGFEITFSLK